MVSGFTLRVLIYFEFIFVDSVRQESSFILLRVSVQFSQHHLLKRLFFELWCWRRFLRVPWTARRSNQSILKEINPGISVEGMMLKLNLQYFGHLMRRVDSLEKTDAGRDWGQEKGTTENKMAEWHHWLNGRESEWTPGDGDGQGGLAYCDSWGCKELDTTERLNWTELNWFFATVCFRLCYWLSLVWIFVTPWTELSCHKLLLLLLFSC